MESEAIVYFHGLPGGAGELTLFGAIDELPFVLDRVASSEEEDADCYFGRLADRVTDRFPDKKMRLIGFSIGAAAALRVAAHLGDQVSRIDLVSAAAPLATGDHLPRMAGQLVFRLAAANWLGFSALTKMQSVMMRLAPRLVFNALFASAQGHDSALRDDPAFRSAICKIVSESLSTRAYRREVQYYVDDWSAVLVRVGQRVTLWHGTLDNWSPPDMATALAKALPDCAEIVWIDGASHYSALKAFLERREHYR